MATKPKSKQSLKLGKGKLKLWYLLPAVTLVVIVGVVILRMSHASGRVWSADQLRTAGNVTLKTKSNGTKYIEATATSSAQQAAGDTTLIAVFQNVTKGQRIVPLNYCATVNVTSEQALVQPASAYTPSDSTFTPFHDLSGSNSYPPILKKGVHFICIPTGDWESAAFSGTWAAGIEVKSGSITVYDITETNISNSSSSVSAYAFYDLASGKQLDPGVVKLVDTTARTSYWDAKPGKSAYIRIGAFSGSPWPGTVFCAEVKGLAASSQVAMGGGVNVMNKQMGGSMEGETKTVAKGKTTSVCATAPAQTSSLNYVISPTVSVSSGEVAVYRIYKKQ